MTNDKPKTSAQRIPMRDYFAAAALASMDITTEGDIGSNPNNPHFWYPAHVLAKRAYDIADAMMEYRSE